MRFDPKRKIYLSLVISGIITTLLVVLVIYPLFKKIKGSSEDFIIQKQKQVSFKEEIENLKKIESFYKVHQLNLEKISSLFIDAEVPIEFKNFLEKNAAKSQLSIKISPMAKKETEPWPSLSFQISTSGSFPDFLRFLEKLQTAPYLIEFSNLNVQKITEKGLPLEKLETLSSGDINAIFSIKVFTK